MSDLELHLSVDDAVRWEAALAAFDQLTAGYAPDRHELAAAPRLSHWRRTFVPAVEPALYGRVDDHPYLPGPRLVVTSRLLAIDATAGWARCLSRLYRLADPIA
ncbi:DUF6634 family protein [Methylobacterium haplocladii]|uniref:Uncharacterized protein n=1 Tax=Methylobacterium haplocladii TaxID=1176176 RepID=A0A512IW11_9HYPH|nr:DUF6634 family protein [Methylobacterium haplocladii]GEP01853.1 hypothetical protein MHA02_42400 [Methylobacterium haplocladii]GJD83148.1 hypothetical protein HPGCJGGD_1011 [Methylobacterium haplocladii]GLS61502.1 hypothetical protein GCM10007887_42160 [Methylobacterium haplocladii]